MILTDAEYRALMDAIYDTPVFEEVRADHEAAKAAGYTWHEHWRLEADWAADAEAEREAAMYEEPWRW